MYFAPVTADTLPTGEGANNEWYKYKLYMRDTGASCTAGWCECKVATAAAGDVVCDDS